MAFFMVFNVVMFASFYFKLLGIQYVVMETAMQNNYIPSQEATTVQAYLYNTVDHGAQYIDDCAYYVYTDYPSENVDDLPYTESQGSAYNFAASNPDEVYHPDDSTEYASSYAGTKSQYGSKIRVVVQGRYTFIWPLMPNEQTEEYTIGPNGELITGKAVDGYTRAEEGELGVGVADDRVVYADSAELEERRKDSHHNVGVDLRFSYIVPGLKYYPDLNS